MRRFGVLLTTAAMLLTSGAATAAAQEVPVRVVTAHGAFVPYQPGTVAVTYRPELVPAGAGAHVLSLSASRAGTHTVFAVRGLVPKREYGAHVHTKPCGATGDAAGPHYQHVPDPVQPSVDPQYANPRNEIWLDFTTDALGNGYARSSVNWEFGARRGQSVVIHETHTHTDPGHAGTAGARLACLTVDF